jgi:hypothetical protein
MIKPSPAAAAATSITAAAACCRCGCSPLLFLQVSLHQLLYFAELFVLLLLLLPGICKTGGRQATETSTATLQLLH